MGRKGFIQQCIDFITQLFSRMSRHEPMSSGEVIAIFLLLAVVIAAIAMLFYLSAKKRKKQNE
jgi:hypothetical protein